MKFSRSRFFDNGSYAFCETIEWHLVGTQGIAIDDPRWVAIGETRNHPITGVPGFDRWIPVVISNPGFTIPEHTYNTDSRMKISPVDGTASMEIVKTDVVSFNSMDFYSLPLSPGVTEITMEQYNIMK